MKQLHPDNPLHDEYRYSRNTLLSLLYFNTLRLRQNGHHFAGDIFKCIFLKKNVWIFIQMSLKLIPKSLIANKLSFVQIMAWRRSGAKPLSEPMLVYLTDAYMRHPATMS